MRVASPGTLQWRTFVSIVLAFHDHLSGPHLKTPAAFGIAASPMTPLADLAVYRTFVCITLRLLGQVRASVAVEFRWGHQAARASLETATAFGIAVSPLPPLAHFAVHRAILKAA